jgi:hypothetical protein
MECFRGVEIRDKGVYFVRLDGGGCAIYQQKGSTMLDLTDYYYRIYVKSWRSNAAYVLSTCGSITYRDEVIEEFRFANENEIELLRSFVKRVGGDL